MTRFTRMQANVLFLLFLSGVQVGEPAKAAPPAGFRARLALGQLFLPAQVVPRDDRLDVLLHLHGAVDVCEQNLSDSGCPCALVAVTLPGLSAVYARKFQEPDVFPRLIEDATEVLAEHLDCPNLRCERVHVSSFSAGFGGVRELLKAPAAYERISTLILADSLYAGYLEPLETQQVDPALMAGFLRFAQDAAAGRKRMVVSHCELRPEGYASTKEMADYLLQKLGLERTAANEVWGPHWVCRSRCEQSGFSLFGFDGDSGADHLQHLRQIGRLWSRIGHPVSK